MDLATVLADYQLTRRLRASSAYQLHHSLRIFEAYLGHAATIRELNPATVNAWLVSLERTHGQRTVAGHRVNLLSLWRDAADRGLVSAPARVRKVPRPRPCPVSWTADELSRVARCASQFHGLLTNGVPRATYFEALVHAAYDSGLRRSDLWTLRRSQIRSDGTIVMRQQKTGLPHHPVFRERTMQLLRSLPGDTPLAWPGDPRRFYVEWQALILFSDVPNGSLQQIRRTGATMVKRATGDPEAVRRYLGHSSLTMQRHYVDESIAVPHPVTPPPLG